MNRLSARKKDMMRGSPAKMSRQGINRVGEARKENIMNLLPKGENSMDKTHKSLYKSKYNEKIKDQSKANKFEKRTMGSLSDPKSSRTPLKRKSTKSDLQTNLKISSDLMVKAQERNSESKREPLWKQQSISKRGVEMRDLPQASKGSNASISNKKNTSESNLIKNSNTKTKIKPKDSIDNIKTKGAEKRNSNIILDHVSGTRQDAVKAGLKPYYSQKNKFGKVPNYLKKRKQDLQNHAREVEAAKTSGHNGNDIQQLEEEERHSLIVGLKAKWEATMKQYQSLSVIVDTVSKKRRKLDLEKQLDELESDHQLLTKSPIIFVV